MGQGGAAEKGYRVALGTALVTVIAAACTSAPPSTDRQSPPAATSSAASGGSMPTSLHQENLRARSRNVRTGSVYRPSEVVIALTSNRTLGSGDSGAVLSVRGVGKLVGTCQQGQPSVSFTLTYHGPGPPTVDEVQQTLNRPLALHLLAPFWPPGPTPPPGANQRLAFFQMAGGGEAGDFGLVFWTTLTPTAAGCVFVTNGVLRLRGDLIHRLG